MWTTSYNSLFLRVLWTGEDGSRFRSSGGRSFPWDSSQAFSSRIFRLFARSNRKSWTRGAIKITNNERVQVNNVRLLIQTLQLQYKLMSIETLGSIDEHQASDVTCSSGGGSDKWRRTIHRPSFLRPSWSKEQNGAQRVHMHNRFIFQHERHRGLAAPLPFGLKMFEGGFHICNTQSVGQVLLFIYNTIMRLLYWSTISSSLTLDRWHQRRRGVILWLKALSIPFHSVRVPSINLKASNAAMLLQIFQLVSAKARQRCESLCGECPSWYILPLTKPPTCCWYMTDERTAAS